MIQHSCVRNSTSVFMYFHDCIISGHYGKSTWSGSCSRRAHTEQALMSVRSTTGDEEHTTVVMTPAQPRIVLLFSGKRKSGKDYVTDLLQHRLTAEVCCILRLSAPLKLQYAQDHNLDYEELLGCGQYKEEYRADMIRWGEMKRRQDSGFFCRLAIRHAARPVWIISDCRRRSDLQWFRQEFPDLCVCVRVEASEQTRSQRGWRFTAGVDDAESECGLDEGVTFDWIIRNDGDDDVLEKQLEELLSLVTSRLDSHTLNDVKTQQ